MITEIAHELVKSLSTSVPFIDKWAGLVKPMKKMVDKKEKTFPVHHNTATTCSMDDYTALVPDSTKTSVCYVEKLSDMTVEEVRRNYYRVSVPLRIVLWYNLDRINEGNYIDESIIASNVLSQIPRSLPNSLFTYSKSVNIFPTGITTGADLFTNYTYDEVRTQYVTHPYGAVGIDIEVIYIIVNCADTLIPSLKCNQPDYVP